VWIHTDLLRPNLLVAGGRLGAVIDFGGVGAGDPAADLIVAWSVFGPAGRAAFRGDLKRVRCSYVGSELGFHLHLRVVGLPRQDASQRSGCNSHGRDGQAPGGRPG
jgi:Phosphotransferase enzyme family